MFSTKLSRVANRATCAAAHNPSATAHRSTSCLATRRSHQRRHSSSKASCPPDSSPSGGKPAPATEAASGKTEPAGSQTSQRGQKRVSSKSSKKARTAAAAAAKSEDQFAGLPSVPGTQHIDERDLRISSFFALHRPIAVGTSIPRVTSTEEFDHIFEARKEANPWENGNSAEGRPENVVYALGSLFENLEMNERELQDDGVRWEVMQESPSNQDGVTHLDGQPRLKSIDEQVANFKPFNAPPPPEPFPAEQMKGSEKRKATSKPKQKSYETTIIVTEYTDQHGQRSYTAESSPIVQISTPNAPASVEEPQRLPFIDRMRRHRQQQFQLRQRGIVPSIRCAPSASRQRTMFLISVKRQRKLKMKKHKYKKLMKRTRNLRRRQDRA
ncbi:Hypothetical predicted protein [Lecanosticta acicola]|uniref:Small ribosomal subunit protein mS38 n=1 Tax=Lecanosticta acicola TaxID=111012 RepID=A0AAI8Z175_9PEZI|nr:Hypothetical predicted protein [Lecanosticta acicola]